VGFYRFIGVSNEPLLINVLKENFTFQKSRHGNAYDIVKPNIASNWVVVEIE